MAFILMFSTQHCIQLPSLAFHGSHGSMRALKDLKLGKISRT
jgi:hypothetical protein